MKMAILLDNSRPLREAQRKIATWLELVSSMVRGVSQCNLDNDVRQVVAAAGAADGR